MPEYSREPGEAHGPATGALARIPELLAGLTLLGAILLLVAEATTLYTVHTSSSRAAVASTGTGSHHSYALVPIALLAGFLGIGLIRARGRPVLLAIGALGIVALLLALVGDLPDAQASGVIGSIARGNITPANDTPDVGLYLETLGAVVLIVTAGTGLLLTESWRNDEPRLRRRSVRQSASES